MNNNYKTILEQQLNIRLATLQSKEATSIKKKAKQVQYTNGFVISANIDKKNISKQKEEFFTVLADATNKALDITYAKQPDVPMFRSISSFIVRNGLTVVLPFPRFMFKSMELMAENSGGALVPIINKVYRDPKLRKNIKKAIDDLEVKQEDLKLRDKELSDIDKGKLKQLKGALEDSIGDKGTLTRRESRSISRNTTGLLAISAATMYAYEQLEGQDYKFIRDGQGNVIDTTPLFPLRQ